jgi:hypothetical protein
MENTAGRVGQDVLAEEIVIAWTAPPLPHPVAPNQIVIVWTAAQNRVLTDLALARGDQALAAYYTARALLCEHEYAPRQQALATT